MTSIEIARGFEAPVGRRDATWAKGPVVPRELAALRRLGLLLAAGAGIWTTALVVTTPALRIGAQHAELHAQIATAGALVALLVALLAAGRYRRHAAAGDLLLAGALALLGISNLLFTLVPAATGHTPGELSTCLPVSGRLLAAGLLAAAAFAPAAPIGEPARAARLLAAGTFAAVAALAFGLAAFGPGLASPSPGHVALPVLTGSAGALLPKGLSAALVAVAAVGFAMRGRRRLDWFSVLLSWGMVLLAFAWLNYLLVPSLYVDWFYAGDALKLAAFLLLAGAAVAEIRSYQHDLAQVAAQRERGRLARDLHDGVAQELAYLLGQARRLRARQPEADVEPLLSAAERALDESRIAISALRAPAAEPLRAALERIAGELSRRLELDVRVSGEASPDVAPPVREALLRIVGEAVVNAARHGGARGATIELRGEAPLTVAVRDDGHGFDPDPARIPPGAFGLLSMRERAEACGGRLTVRSAPDACTEIEVVLP